MKKFTLFFVALLISMTAFARDIYFDPWQWTSDNAKFTAWVWGGSAGNGVMVAVNYDEVSALYKCTIADDATNMLFLRKSSQSLDWENEWNRTEDLSILAEQNKFTVTTWDGGKDGKSSGSWSTYTPAVTPEPEPEPDPEPTTYTVYFDSNGTGWTKVNAYCWNASGNNSWPGVAMTPVEGHSGFYTYTTDQSYDNIIFNDGSNQTHDLVVPTDGKNCYSFSTKTWSVYTAPVEGEPIVTFTNLNPTAGLGATIKPEATAENIENPTYVYTVSYEGGEAVTVNATEGYVLEKHGSYEFTVVATGDEEKSATATYVVNVKPTVVAGTSELCRGHLWSATALDNAMYPVNGVYTITYENVPAGDYEFKVVYLDAWLGADKVDAGNSTPGFGGSGDGNISFTLAFPTDITISYNPTTEKIILIGEGLSQFGEFVLESYTLCGSKVIFGGDADSDPTLAANDMEENNGVWTKTYTNVPLEVGEYKYKVAANHKWNGAQYPSNGDMILTISEAGKYNLTFTFEPNKAEGEKLTVEIQPLAAPVVTLTESAYFVDNFEVVVTCEGKDADTKVYYQIGEAEALEYTAESVKITETSTIKAWSERYGQKSEVVVATYTKLNQPQLPESATFEDTKEIVITGAMVKYTLNGGEVKDYTAPFTIAETTTVVAWAQAGDVKTAEVSVTYTKQEVVVPEGPKVVTIAEFLAAEVNAEVWYELTGVITDIKSADYGNVTIKDETGSVYIYGLTKTQVSSNDKSFASLDLVVNDTVTLRTVRGEFNGEVQGGGKTTPAYYVSHKDYVAPEQPEALVEYVDEQGRIVYPFANVPEFNSWGNSYVEHVVEYNDATVTFEGASRQTTNIKDIPVTKGKYVQLTLKDATKAITSVRLVCRQWGSKAQTITLNAGASEAGLDTTEVTSSNFVLETNELPTNSTVIKFTFSTENQIGIDSIYYTVADKVAVAIEQPTVSVVGGEKYEAFDVELACATVDAKVYYTLNGGEKTEYTAPIKISATTELKTWAELGENVSEAIVVNYTFPAEVADIAALIADETGKNVRIAATLTVIAQTGKYLWVKDASMSMLVYGTAPTTYKNGDQLTGLVGTAAVYNGAKQITPAYFPEAVAGTPVEPTVIALADVTAATVHQYIKLEGVTYTNATTLTAGDNTLAMYNRFGYTYAGEEGDKVDVIAIAGLYNETVQVYPISIEKVATVEPTTFTVYFENTENWSTVNAYCWQTESGDKNAEWPGVAMTPVEGHDGFYSYTTTTAYDNIIFNNGEGVKTIDLTFPEDNNVFTINGNDENGKKTGAWTVYVAPDPNKPVVSFTNLNATAELGATIKPEATAKNIENPTFVYTVSYESGEAITLDENGYSLNDYGVYEFTVVATGDNDVTATATFTVTVELVAVLGSKELCHGYYWERAKENAMYPVDGIYTITYKDVLAGTYEFKVGFGKQAMLGIESIDKVNSTPGFTGENNISFTLSETTDIVISYSTLTGKVILQGVGLEQFGEFVATSYTLCGSAAIFEDEFNTTLTANDMVETSTGVWTKTYSNVVLKAGEYLYKVAANYGWNVGQYPAAGDLSLKIDDDGEYTLTFTFEPNKVEGEKLTVTYTKQEVVVPEGPKVVTIAEFLAAEVNAEVWYELTGVITDIKSADYGNVTIKDETGSVYIYGLTKTQVSSNDKSFASLDLVVNDTVTLRTVRGEFNGEVQGGGKTTPAYYVSHKKYVVPEGGEDPEQPEALVEYVDEQGRTVYPFANVPGFAEWGTSYAEHVVEYNDAIVTFEKANKQQAGNTIDDIPVTKGNYVQLALKDATKAITSVRLVCRQWGSKAQTITLNAGASEAGLAATKVESSNFVLETNELPTNSTIIRFTFSSTSDQIGIDSIYYTVGDKVAVAVEQPTVSVVGGEKYEAFVVELACATVDAKVYYTLNGGEKTEYTAPIKISNDTELKAWAEKGEEKSAELVVNYTFPAEVADIAALIADETGKNVRIAATLTVIAQKGKYLWVKDASMSMLVYGEAPATYKNGDQLTGLVGKAAVYNGAKQITPAYFPEVATGTPVEPTVIALADVTAATVHQYIKLEDVTYTNATTLTAGDNTLAMYDRFGYTYAGEEGDKVDVIAIAGLYNETVQVYPISIEKVAIVEPTTFTVYFENTENWSTVNAYCWQTESGDKNAEWPGVAMTPVEGHDGFYSYTTTTAYDNIIFNNGEGVKTIDLTFPEDNNVFTINGNDENGKKTGAWTVYVAPDPNKPVVSFTNLNPTAELGATIKPEVTAKNIENPTYVYTVSYEGGEAIAVDAKEGYVLEKYGSYAFTVVATGDEDKSATATYVVKVNPIAVVAGVSGLCHGEGWSTTSVKNAMYLVDGVYTITYENVPAGDYEFKVVYEGDWYGKYNYDAENSTPGATYEDNIGFTLVQPTTIKISFNSSTKKITLVGVGIDQFGVFVATSYTLCGSAEIFGEKDAPTLTDNDMTETAEGSGIWTKTYENIALEANKEYTYKVAANHDWNAGQYPAGANSIWLSIAEAGNYNLTFTYEPNKVEGEKLTCVVEKINQGPITEVENGTIANIYTQNGLIVVEGEYQIFTITGQNVTQMNGNLIRGVYIVRTVNATSKVIIK